MAKTKMKAKTKNILLIVLSCILIFGAIFGIIAMFSEDESTTKKVSPSYAVGGLTADGKYMETKESIYTKDAFECVGLSITPVFTSTVSYEVFFYNEDSGFISKSGKLTDAYNERPELAKYARVVITPNDDTDIKWYEVSGYAKQLTIEVDKEQEIVRNNLFEIDSEMLNKFFTTQSCLVGQEYVLTDSSSGTLGSCKFIDCRNFTTIEVRSHNGNLPAWCYIFIDDEDLTVEIKKMEAQKIEDGIAVMTISVPEGATQFSFAYQVGVEYDVYAY